MMIKLSERSGKVLESAYQTALAYQIDYIGTEHILKGIIDEEGTAAKILNQYNLNSATIVEVLNQFNGKEIGNINHYSDFDANVAYQMMTPRTKQVLNLAARESDIRNSNVIEPEHLVLGILREGDSVAVRILRSANIRDRKSVV